MKAAAELDLTGQDNVGEPVFDQTGHAPQRARTVLGIIALIGQVLLGRLGAGS